MLPVNTPLLSQNEPTSSGGRRGVNTDGGSHPDDSRSIARDNLRPQSSAGTLGRSSGSSAAAFAAAQAHAFGSPRQFEDRLKAIARGLHRHPRGRDPSEQDVRLVALLLDHQPHDDPDIANQHILDAVLPLNSQQVDSIINSFQRGDIHPSDLMDAAVACTLNPYSPFHPSLDPAAFAPTTPAPGSSTTPGGVATLHNDF